MRAKKPWRVSTIIALLLAILPVLLECAVIPVNKETRSVLVRRSPTGKGGNKGKAKQSSSQQGRTPRSQQSRSGAAGSSHGPPGGPPPLVQHHQQNSGAHIPSHEYQGHHAGASSNDPVDNLGNQFQHMSTGPPAGLAQPAIAGGPRLPRQHQAAQSYVQQLPEPRGIQGTSTSPRHTRGDLSLWWQNPAIREAGDAIRQLEDKQKRQNELEGLGMPGPDGKRKRPRVRTDHDIRETVPRRRSPSPPHYNIYSNIAPQEVRRDSARPGSSGVSQAGWNWQSGGLTSLNRPASPRLGGDEQNGNSPSSDIYVWEPEGQRTHNRPGSPAPQAKGEEMRYPEGNFPRAYSGRDNQQSDQVPGGQYQNDPQAVSSGDITHYRRQQGATMDDHMTNFQNLRADYRAQELAAQSAPPSHNPQNRGSPSNQASARQQREPVQGQEAEHDREHRPSGEGSSQQAPSSRSHGGNVYRSSHLPRETIVNEITRRAVERDMSIAQIYQLTDYAGKLDGPTLNRWYEETFLPQISTRKKIIKSGGRTMPNHDKRRVKLINELVLMYKKENPDKSWDDMLASLSKSSTQQLDDIYKIWRQRGLQSNSPRRLGDGQESPSRDHQPGSSRDNGDDSETEDLDAPYEIDDDLYQ